MNQSSTLCAERSIIPNTRWMYMVREETDKKANDLQTKLFVARYLENMSDARKLRCVYFVDIQHMKNSRRLWTMRVESWKFRCQQQCLAEPDAKSTVKPAAFWTNVRQNTHTAYGRNSTPRSWRSYCREESQPLQSCAQVSSDASCDAKTRCESSSGERMGKLEKMPAWQLTKVRNKKEVTAEWSKEWTQNSTCASMDLWHLGNSELESQCHEQSSCSRRWHSRRWSRLLRSVFFEQGSSVSQMAAAKVMDNKSRLPGRSGQAADAASAYTQAKNGRCSTIIENSQSQNVQTFGFVCHDTNGINHGPVWTPHLVSLFSTIWWKQCSQFPGSSMISTSPERLTHPWMYWWRNMLKIIGTFMEIENCQIRG